MKGRARGGGREEAGVTKRSWPERLYRRLLAVYPRRRRREVGDDMSEMFADICRYEPESRGLAGRSRLVAATLRDLASGSWYEHRPFIDRLAQDLRYGVRRLLDNPTLTIVAVLTLALGIGAVTSIYSFVDALVFHPLPYPEVDRIVALGEITPRRSLNGEGWTHPAELRSWQELASLESVSGLTPFFVTMTGAGDPQEVFGYRATASHFSILGVAPLHGRTFAPGGGTNSVSPGDERTVVLGNAFWRRHFAADPGIVGNTIRLDGRETTVIGVMPRGAEFPMGTDMWLPLMLSPEQWASYSEPSVRTIGLLAPGATIEQLRAELEPLTAAVAESNPDHAEVRIDVEPLLANVTLNTRTALAILMGASAFLLLLVCGNVANMLLAETSVRRREMAVRMALGARRSRLVRQLLTESIALAALAAVAGSVLAARGGELLRAGLSAERWRFYFTGIDEIGINTSVLAFTAAVSVGSVVAFGLAPALHCSRVDLHEALKQSVRGGSRGAGRWRRGLVALEVALSVVLLIGAGLMAQSMGAFARIDPGIDTEVIAVQLRVPRAGYEEPERLRSFFEETIGRARAIPGVISVAATIRIPASSAIRPRELELESPIGRSPEPALAERHVFGGAFFETLGMSVLQGTDALSLGAGGGEAGRSVVVSAALAERLWPGASALGRRLRFAPEEPWRSVTGVVSDVARAWNDGTAAAVAYVPDGYASRRATRLLLRVDGDIKPVIDELRRQVWGMDDAVVVYAPVTIESTIADQASGIRAMSKMVSWMAAIGLLVCLGGIYAIVSFAVEQRSPEIGVRMALGANGGTVVRMIVLQGLASTGIGIGIGLLLAFALARLLSGFMDGALMSVDLVVFAVLTAVMVLMATLSSWLPARRAARVDPVMTLRAE